MKDTIGIKRFQQLNETERETLLTCYAHYARKYYDSHAIIPFLDRRQALSAVKFHFPLARISMFHPAYRIVKVLTVMKADTPHPTRGT